MDKKIALITATGQVINFNNFDPESIRAYDIAWALHNTNRYNGHTPYAWDVLSHTGLAFLLYVHDVKGKVETPFSIALMLHDAVEAYLGDLVWAVKSLPIAAELENLETEITKVILRRFNINYDAVEWTVIDRYDHQASYVEVQRFFPDAPRDCVMGEQYHLDRLPNLSKAKVTDYIEGLRNLCINNQVEDINVLFDLPESLAKRLTEETDSPVSGARQPVQTIEVRETNSVESLTL